MDFTPLFEQPLHPLAVEVCRILQDAGFQAYIVGGCVRDLHLGLTPKDWDICTNATPPQVAAYFQRTLPTGLQHGTVTVCMNEGVENHFEVTTFRTEGQYLDGRRPEVVHFVNSIREDLARRDFTINAMAYDPIGHVSVDPFGGLDDIRNGIIRAVGDANARFQEDGLRIMRAARFAARFGFTIDLETLQGMKESRETLRLVSKERISDELRKTVMADHPSDGLSILSASGALEIACPTLVDYETCLLPLYKGRLETRLAFLYCTIPVEKVEQELNALKMSNKEIKRILFLLETLERYRQFKREESVTTYKQFMARIKNESPDHWETTLEQFVLLSNGLVPGAEHLLYIKYNREIVYARKELAINGDDLMEIGVPQGPMLKLWLARCYAEILINPELNDKKYLLGYISQNLDF